MFRSVLDVSTQVPYEQREIDTESMYAQLYLTSRSLPLYVRYGLAFKLHIYIQIVTRGVQLGHLKVQTVKCK